MRFVYTHEADEVDADDVTVRYTDEGGRELDEPLSEFTSAGTIGRGDRVTIDGALLTTAIEVRHSGDRLASRGGPARDWLQAGGYPLPLALAGGLAEWDLSGEVDLDAAMDRLQVVSDESDYTCDEDGCRDAAYTSTVRFTDGLVEGDAELDGHLALAAAGRDLELRLDGTWVAGVLANLHVLEESTRPDDERVDADFGFDLDLTARGDGLARFRIDDGRIVAGGTEGDLDVSGRIAVWDDEHPRSEAYSPGSIDDFDIHSPYEEQPLPFGDNPSEPVAQALGDLWRMDLAPGDEFRMESPDFDGPVVTLLVRVVDEGEKRVPAGTFDALRVESTTSVRVPYDGGEETFDLPTLTTWIDTDSGLPVAFEETFAYDYDEQDLAPLFEAIESFGAVDVTPPEELSIRLQGRPLAELSEFEDGLHMAPMASLLLPLAGVGAPFLFAFPMYGLGMPFGGGYDGYDEAYPESPESPAMESPPQIAFARDATGPGGRLTVVAADWGVSWFELSATDGAGDECVTPFGDVRAGDVVTCLSDGTARVVHWPSNTLLYESEL